MRRARWLLAAALGAAVLSACDPCAGTANCRVDPRVSYSGKIIDFPSGRGAAGVAVSFRRTDGASLAADSLAATTDGEGRFELRVGATGGGDVVGELTIRPPAPLPAYTVPGVRLSQTSVGGGGGVLPTYVTQPYVDYVAELRYRRGNVPMANASVTFVRTGGAPFAGPQEFRVTAGADGWFHIQRPVTATGTVIGELRVEFFQYRDALVVPNVVLPVHVADRLPQLDRSFLLGASLVYVVELRQRGTGAPVADADVEFRRTGGIPLASPTFTARTNAEGRVAIELTPEGEISGEVVGELTVRSAALPHPFVIRGVRLRTYDGDQPPFYGVVGVGYQASAAGELYFRGDRSALGDAEVTFERTGGIAARPERVTTRSLPDGRFGVTVATDTIGDVVGDLVVRVPGAASPTRLSGVRLRATGDDTVRYAGRFGVGSQLLYVGQLQQRATGAPQPGWTVRFRRTGGIPLVRDTVSAVSLDWGGFAIAPDTRVEGEVEGELTASAPGGASVALGTVRLRTMADDSVRLAGRWNVGPSLLYVGELLREDGRPIDGARVEFRRTGGLATAESTLVERSNAVGRFRLAPTPLGAGTVIGELHISPPAPLRDTVITNVTLPTFESDEVRLRAVWRLPDAR